MKAGAAISGVTLAVVLALSVGACAGTRGESDVRLVPRSDAAVSADKNVRMTVDPTAWSDRGGTLPQGVIALKVTIENLGGMPLHVSYQGLSLQMPPASPRHPLSLSSLATSQMRERAFPEGEIVAGELTEGFLYFPNPGDAAGRATFVADLQNGSDSPAPRTLKVSLVVD